MATFKATVRTPRKDGFYQVYIRVVQNTRPGYIRTDKIVSGRMIDKSGNILDPFVNEYCVRMILNYADKLNRKDCSRWTVRQIIEHVTQDSDDICFSDYAAVLIHPHIVTHRTHRISGTTKVLFKSLRLFR